MIVSADHKTIVLVGQPNSGKSTLFNVLSDLKTSTANYAGTSASVNKTEINVYGDTYTLIDLPGSYTLNPISDSEKLTTNFLLLEKFDLIVNVVDASLLTRSLELTVELAEFGMPMVIALNMYDEAQSHGIDIDIDQLERKLKVPVIPTMALYGKGIKKLMDTCYNMLNRGVVYPEYWEFTPRIEKSIAEIKSKINIPGEYNGNSRFYAIKSIENPVLVPEGIMRDVKSLRDDAENVIVEQYGSDGFEAISYERHHLSMKLTEDISTFRITRRRKLVDKLDDFLLHPILGYVILGGFLMFYFFTIFVVGNAIGGLVDGPISKIPGFYEGLKAGSPFLWYTINGAYQGLAGIFGIVLPYFLPLVLLTSIFEDTGYLSRTAFLVDGLFHKIGLHGKSVVPFILGFGCSVPALYAARMIENPRDRMITGILIPFIPCSARIAVIFALTAAFTGPIWAFVVFAYILIIVSLSGKALSKALSKPMGLILEIPNLKTPSLKIAMTKTWVKIRELLKEAFIFLLAGSIILGWIEYFNASKYVDYIFSPLLKTVLGLPEQLGSTLVFGFLRKELIIVMAAQALGVQSVADLPLTAHQVVVFIIFVSLYFPCLTTFIVILKEFGYKTGFFSAALSIIIAVVSAFLFKIVLAM